MPLDVDVFPFQPSTPEPTPVVPVGSISDWIETIAPGGLTELDPLVNGVIVVPLNASTSASSFFDARLVPAQSTAQL